VCCHQGKSRKKRVVVTQQQKLVGRAFCFTGVLVGMTRKEAEEMVKQLGAKVAKSITKKVTDVVVGRGGGSKRAEAEKLGVKIIDQAEFEALLGAKPSAAERPKQPSRRLPLQGRVFCLAGLGDEDCFLYTSMLASQGAETVQRLTSAVTDVVADRSDKARVQRAEQRGLDVLDLQELKALVRKARLYDHEDEGVEQSVAWENLKALIGDVAHLDADEGEDGDHDSAWHDDEPSADEDEAESDGEDGAPDSGSLANVVPMRSDDFWSAFEARGEKDPVTGMPREVVDRLTGAVLVLIPAGEFVMGSPKSEADRSGDEGQHRRVIRKPFYLGKTAVTQAQWRKVMGSNPSVLLEGDDLPVDSVSWYNCQEFLKKAGGGMRLPSEAEWEYACRAGTTTPFSFGATITPEQVNYDGNRPYGGASKGLCRMEAVAVGSLPANAWGLHEMHGNVREWCQDGYEAYPGSGTEEPAPDAGARVLRGGGWGNRAAGCRAANRGRSEPGSRGNYFGLRLARTLPD
jgi:formylglycine-generating enzyme required for sulfatase activity